MVGGGHPTVLKAVRFLLCRSWTGQSSLAAVVWLVSIFCRRVFCFVGDAQGEQEDATGIIEVELDDASS